MFEKQRGGDTAHSNFGYMVRCSNKGGDTAQSSMMLQKSRGGHCTFHLSLSGKIFKQENPYGGWGGGWWWVGWVVLSGNITTSWLHLSSWKLPDSQLSWESRMEPSVAINPTPTCFEFTIILIKTSTNINHSIFIVTPSIWHLKNKRLEKVGTT